MPTGQGWRIRFTEDAMADLAKLDNSVAVPILDAIESRLKEEPEKRGNPLRNKLGGYRRGYV